MSAYTRSKPTPKHAAPRCICPPTPTQPLPELPPDLTKQHADAAITAIRTELPKIETNHDSLANTLIRHLFRSNPAYALDPSQHPTNEYKTVQAFAATNLRFDSASLSRHVRVGALNLIFGEKSAWSRLPWTFKVELLPLLELDGSGGALADGIDEASKPGMTLRELQDWKRALKGAMPKKDKPPQRGLDLGTLGRLVSHGSKLHSSRSRTELLKKIARLSEEEQADTIRGMVLAARNLVTTINRYGEANGVPGFTMSDEEIGDEEVDE